MSLPPKTVMTWRAVIDLDLVLAGQLGPVDVGLIAAVALDDERPDPGPVGDDVGRGEGRVEVEPGVDLSEQEVPVLVGDLGVRSVDPGIGGADHRSPSHRNDVEQTPGVVEEGQDPLVLGELRDDEVDALRVHDAMIGLRPEILVECVDERSGGVDDHPGTGR